MLAVVARSPILRNPRVFAVVIRGFLEAMVYVNRLTLRALPNFPKLYNSGVRYQEEPPDTESIVDMCTVLQRGHGDCAHLACWRVAECIERENDHATLKIDWVVDHRPGSTDRLFHIVVRHQDGTVEDVSKALGMGKAG